MAANGDYYGGKSWSRAGDNSSNNNNNNYKPSSSYSYTGAQHPPAYASQQHLKTTTPASLSGSSSEIDLPPPVGAATVSPFDSVFDDHVYPANTSQRKPQMSQQSASYHSLSRVSSEEMAHNHATDDIPLREQSGQSRPVRSRGDSSKDSGLQDHVYDRSQREPKRPVRFGELGMLGADAQRIPWAVYFFSLVQVAVFVGEIVKNTMETGSPIMTRPSFNPMIGPSPYILINMGARFVPCMHTVKDIPSATRWQCPNTVTNDPTTTCTLSELCGFGGFGGPDQSQEPNQWFRFITPIFMHAGIIHIGFNLLLQLTIGKEMERSIGTIRFTVVYLCAGIFGFVLGGNYAGTGVASTGASGSLFGIIALTLLDLLYSWKDRRSPVKDLMFIMLDVLISFVLGLLPGLDNFSHIGGFFMGLALGICVLHSPNSLRRRIGQDDSPYSSMNGGPSSQRMTHSLLNPVGFFKGRKPLWWAWWLIRAGALVLATVFFILLLNNFYVSHTTCSWCKYLSCLPVNNWCNNDNVQVTTDDSHN